MPERLYSTIEAAKILSVSPSQLKLSRSKNGLLFGRVPPEYVRLTHKTVKYKEKALQTWVDNL